MMSIKESKPLHVVVDGVVVGTLTEATVSCTKSGAAEVLLVVESDPAGAAALAQAIEEHWSVSVLGKPGS